MRIGIFGGSFNPIHNTHITLARQLLESARLDEVWLMVSPQNPLKQQADLLADDLRMEMARRAVEQEKGIVASDYEMQLPRPSYTWNTLQRLSHDYPEHKFVLLVGGDNWTHFERWYHWQDILWHYDIVVYPRTDNVSSTEIRRRIHAGESFEDMMPKAVAEFIKEKGLYA